MTAIALLRFRQGANIGAGGHALVVAISGTTVTIENTSNIDVASYRIELLHAPPDSTIYPITPGVSAPVELAVGNGVPTATLDVSEAGIYGCYRIRLTVWPLLNQGGVPDVDIRNVAVATPGFGIILPPYQKFPDPLPLEGAGSKLDELNFAGQARGWAGPAYHAVTYPWRLLHSALKALIPAAPVSVGSANAEGSAATIARSDHVHAHGNQAGGTLHAGGTETTAGFITAAQVTTLNNAFKASDLPQWRTVLDTDFGTLGDLGPFSANDPIALGGVTWLPIGFTVAAPGNHRTFQVTSGVGLSFVFQSSDQYTMALPCDYVTNDAQAAPRLTIPLLTIDPQITRCTPLRISFQPGDVTGTLYPANNTSYKMYFGLEARRGPIWTTDVNAIATSVSRAVANDYTTPTESEKRVTVVSVGSPGWSTTAADRLIAKSMAIQLQRGVLGTDLEVFLGGSTYEDPWQPYTADAFIRVNDVYKTMLINSFINDIANWKLALSCACQTNMSQSHLPFVITIRAIRVEAFY